METVFVVIAFTYPAMMREPVFLESGPSKLLQRNDEEGPDKGTKSWKRLNSLITSPHSVIPGSVFVY